MKDKNDLVYDKWQGLSFLSNSLDEIRTKYEKMVNSMEVKQAQINTYNEMFKKHDELEKKDIYPREMLTFKNRLDLYNILDNLLGETFYRTGNSIYQGIDLKFLIRRLLESSDDVKEYVDLVESVRNYKKRLSDILTENISFYGFNNGNECHMKHSFVNIDDQLVCMHCGASTKDFNMTKEDVEFLTKCASAQNLLLENATKDDIALLKVLIAKNNEYLSKRTPMENIIDDEDFSLAEEYYLEDESENFNLNLEVQKAHILDSREFPELPKVSNPKYLSEDKMIDLLKGIDREIEKVKGINSRFKDLLIEECKTARYEVLILFGVHIPTLYEQAKNEDDEIAFIKAYIHMSNSNFRKNTDYFNHKNRDWDAISYDCITAHPEINQKVLEMKYDRK